MFKIIPADNSFYARRGDVWAFLKSSGWALQLLLCTAFTSKLCNGGLILAVTRLCSPRNVTLARNVLVNEKKDHSFILKKSLSQSIISNNKNELWKTGSLTSFQKPQLLQSVLMIFFYIFTELFIPSCNVLSGYFYVSLNLKAALIVWILRNFVTQLL